MVSNTGRDPRRHRRPLKARGVPRVLVLAGPLGWKANRLEAPELGIFAEVAGRA